MQQALNAVIYARYSSHSQQEQSIEGQLRDCYAYALPAGRRRTNRATALLCIVPAGYGKNSGRI